VYSSQDNENSNFISKTVSYYNSKMMYGSINESHSRLSQYNPVYYNDRKAKQLASKDKLISS
jgi:hypothetical protein